MNLKHYTLIDCDSKVDLAIKYIEKYDYLSYDTETTGLNVRKDKIIGFSFSGESGTAMYVSRYEYNQETDSLNQLVSDDNILKILNLLKNKELIMWNGSFDIRVTLSNFDVSLLDSLMCEGMLLKHTLNEEAKMGLKDTMIELQEYLDMDMEKAANEEQIELKENVKSKGGSVTKGNFEMYKADLGILFKYACADADFTLRICKYLNIKLVEEGLDSFFFDEEVMPLYKEVTIPMEMTGIQLDLGLITKTKEEIVKDIKLLESQIVDEIVNSKEGKAWLNFVSSNKFPPSNKGNFAQEVARHFNLDFPKSKNGKYSITEKTIKLIKDQSNKALLFLKEGNKEYIKDHVEAISLSLWKVYNSGLINISSKKQLSELVFDFFKFKPISKTDKGANQFNDATIDVLKESPLLPWASKLSSYNKLVKMCGAYIDRFLDNNEDGFYYFYYKQHGTISGRFSSDAQQLPRPKEEGELDPIVLKYNNLIRKFFISGDGKLFIDSDYESLEPHVFAHVSSDEGLRDIFRKGHDFYSTIAIATEKIEGVSADKKSEIYLGKVAKPKRQMAKGYCLGVPYGMSDFALAKNLDISIEEAGDLINGYLDAYPNLKKWMKDSKEQSQHLGYVKTELGRVRHLNKVKDIHSRYGEKLLDFKFRKSIERRLGSEEVLSMYRDYKNGVNNARNFQIQGLSASIINRAMIEINREFIKRNIQGNVCATIHDQCIIIIEEARAEEASKIVEEKMCNTTKISVQLKAPAEICKNWKDGH